MSNRNIETFRGTLPRCRGCGDFLKANYRTESETVFTDKPSGRKKVYANTEYDDFADPDPGDEDEAAKDGFVSSFGGVTWFWDKKKRQWYKWEPVYRVKSRKFLGTFGVEGNGFFCSIRCAYLWAVQQCKQ